MIGFGQPPSDAASREAAYRELFRYELEPGLVDEIRRATNGNYALEDAAFAAQVTTALGRRAACGARKIGSATPDGNA